MTEQRRAKEQSPPSTSELDASEILNGPAIIPRDHLPTSTDDADEYPWIEHPEGYPDLGTALADGATFKSGQAVNTDDIEVATINGHARAVEADVIAALKQVYDPEIPVNIYDLGLIYSISMQPNGNVAIIMTLTTPNCPVAGSLPQLIADQAASVNGVAEVEVSLTWDPPWDMEKMSEDAKAAMGLFD